MENLINKYKDEYGYILNLEQLYKELLNNNMPINEIKIIINEIIENNNNIRLSLSNKNKNLSKYNKNKQIIEENYPLKLLKYYKNIIPKIIIKNHINIDFYIDYIEKHLDNDEFISILPKKLNCDGLEIIDNILIHYIKTIKEIDIELVNIKDNEDIDFWCNEKNKYLKIIRLIKEYKDSFNYIEKIEEDNFKNEVVYFLNNNDVPYIISDIKNDENSYESIYSLIESIENGTFKQIKTLTVESSYTVYEVRAFKQHTRIVFTQVGKNKYCIILALTNKKEAGTYEANRIKERVKLYSRERDKYELNDDVKKLLLKGEK